MSGLTITWFNREGLLPTAKNPKGKRHEVESWDALFALWRLEAPAKTTDKADLPGWAPATFVGNHRSRETVQKVTGLVLDYDNAKTKTQMLDTPVRPADALGAVQGLQAALYTSWNHSDQWPRFRVVLPLSRPVDAQEYDRLWAAFDRQLNQPIDPQCKDPSRFWYWPARRSDDYQCIIQPGQPLDVDALLAAAPPLPVPAPTPPTPPRSRRSSRDTTLARASAYLAAMAPAIEGQNGSGACFAAACALAIGFDLAESDVLDLLTREYNPRCQPPWSEKELAHKVRDAMKADGDRGHLLRAGKPEAPDIDLANPPPGIGIDGLDSHNSELDSHNRETPAPDPDTAVATQPTRPLTDLGNAERLKDRFGKLVRYCTPWSKWLIWDGTRWAHDELNRVLTMAEATARGIATEAKELAATDERAAQRLAKWAKQSEGAARIQAIVSLARVLPALTIHPDQLDRNPWALNCTNGTIDLERGVLRPHDPADLITKTTGIAFDPTALCPTYDRFLTEVQPDPEVRAFLDRLDGYSLTAVTSQHVVVQHWGTGRNGKGTKLETKLHILGDYAVKIPADTLTVRRNAGHPTEKSVFFGKRFALASETGSNAVLDVSLINELTGADTISCRRMHEDFWSYRPTHKLEIQTNHQLTVRETSAGIWGRMVFVPWLADFSDPAKQDRQLPDKLKAEAPGILARMVRGCLAWQTQGLATPKALLESSKEYRAEQDVLGEFLEERCELGQLYKTSAKALYAEYLAWAKTRSEYEMSQHKLGRILKERGFTKVKNSTMFWVGLRLAIQNDDDATLVATEVGSLLDTSPQCQHTQWNPIAGPQGHGRQCIACGYQELTGLQ